VERPGRDAGTGRRPCAVGSHWQTYQCRFSQRSLDPGCQHHDARTRRGSAPIRAARAGTAAGGRERASAVTAPGFSVAAAPSRAGSGGGGQKASCAETFAYGPTGPAYARNSTSARNSTGLRGSASSGGVERLTSSKAAVARV
jgi:hypothetical protein